MVSEERLASDGRPGTFPQMPLYYLQKTSQSLLFSQGLYRDKAYKSVKVNWNISLLLGSQQQSQVPKSKSLYNYKGTNYKEHFKKRRSCMEKEVRLGVPILCFPLWGTDRLVVKFFAKKTTFCLSDTKSSEEKTDRRSFLDQIKQDQSLFWLLLFSYVGSVLHSGRKLLK